MSYLTLSTSSSLQSTDQGAIGESQRQSLRAQAASIHVLDDDSLLNVFDLYRPYLLGEDENDNTRLVGGKRWTRGRWWYKIAHVCQRWRNIVFGSASYLGVSLVCTNGSSVADMLAHSPPFSLIIEYNLDENEDITAEDEEGIILALRQYDRLRRVRLFMPATILQKLIVSVGDEYPILEHVIIVDPTEDKSTILIFPETFQAPHLRHLVLGGFTLPIGSRLLTTAVGLVTLGLLMVHPSTYFYPNTLLQWLSVMPQLETLVIGFLYPFPNHDVERQSTHTPITTPIALPNLLVFRFDGDRAYLEAFVYWITAPRLEMLRILYFNQLTFFVPRLLQFVSTSENLMLESAKFEFSDGRVDMDVRPHEGAKMQALFINVRCCHLDWQVSSAAQISNLLSPIFFAVEHLALEHEWRKLLSSFRNVKKLCIAKGLVKELSRCLQSDGGELPLELLPELQELTYSWSGDNGDTFSSFINARQEAGRPLTLIRSPSPDPSSSVSYLESSSIAPASGEAGGDPVTYADQRASHALNASQQPSSPSQPDLLVKDLATSNISDL